MAKKKKEEAKAGAPAWMATYGDLVTLLLCFFVLLFAMSDVSEESFAEILASFGNPNFVHQPTVSNTVLPGSGVSMGSGIIQMPVPHSNRFEGTGQTMNNDEIQMAMNSIISDFQTYLLESQNALAQHVEVTLVDDVLTITFHENMLFAIGSAALLPQVVEILDYVGEVIAQHPNMFIDILGHTDSAPINTAQFPNNYFLGFARAHAVHERFTSVHDISTHRMRAISYGDTQPIASNETPEGRAANRRVEIILTPNVQ